MSLDANDRSIAGFTMTGHALVHQLGVAVYTPAEGRGLSYGYTYLGEFGLGSGSIAVGGFVLGSYALATFFAMLSAFALVGAGLAALLWVRYADR